MCAKLEFIIIVKAVFFNTCKKYRYLKSLFLIKMKKLIEILCIFTVQ